MSLSARRAWIEISRAPPTVDPLAVALRKESVDRNWYSSRIIMLVLGVALRKESVDRNGLLPKNTTGTPSSLSARRAWIEIGVLDFAPGEVFVALRKESVDRNSVPRAASK